MGCPMSRFCWETWESADLGHPPSSMPAMARPFIAPTKSSLTSSNYFRVVRNALWLGADSRFLCSHSSAVPNRQATENFGPLGGAAPWALRYSGDSASGFSR
jgi:hypothetical protein